MPDVFISYSSKDGTLAQQISHEIQLLGGSAFLAPFTIEPGKNWGDEILNNLRNSTIVLFLASREACASPYVNQELGGAWCLNKRIIPVLWDISPEELPGWTKQFQAIDVRDGLDRLRPTLNSIVKRLQLDQQKEGLFLFGLGILVFWALGKK